MPGSETGAYARFGAYCSGLQDFDAAHFMLPTPEALALDPHTRHLMHLAQVKLSRQCQQLVEQNVECSRMPDILPIAPAAV